MGWMWICIFSFFGLAKARNVAPVPKKDTSKTELDKDALMAIVHNRFHILSEYHRNVMMPTIKEQKAKMQAHERAMFKKAKRLLKKEPVLVKENESDRIEEMLEHNSIIRTIYEKSHELQEIWKRHPGSRFQEKLQELSEWCRQAEQSGIQCLEEFAQTLRAYSLTAYR